MSEDRAAPVSEDRAARLLFPAIRWDPDAGFGAAEDGIDAALDLGVGGFIVYGGEEAAARALIERVRAAAPYPLLFGADLERGAGQQFRGATPLPPLAAIGHLDDLATTRRAGSLTAREALAVGVDWVYGPVADLDADARNPIVGTRAFGSRPERVGEHVAAWVDGCQATGALACAKHFPGHGRTITDSHAGLPVVASPRAALEADLAPFAAGFRAGAASVMTAHVAFPALDPAGTPATLSAPILGGLLRDRMGFAGIVVTDAMVMDGVRGGADGDPATAGVRALAAGCDALLYPEDPTALAAAIEDALAAGRLDRGRVASALARIAGAAEAAAGVRAAAALLRGEEGWGRAEDVAWARAVARASLVPLAGRAVFGHPDRVVVVDVDDDLGGPYPPPARDRLPEALRSAGLEVIHAPDPGSRSGGRDDRRAAPLLLAVYADIRAWKGRPGLSEGAIRTVGQLLEVRPDALLVLFGHPRLAEGLPGRRMLAAWGGEPIMQEAVAAHVLGRERGGE